MTEAVSRKGTMRCKTSSKEKGRRLCRQQPWSRLPHFSAAKSRWPVPTRPFNTALTSFTGFLEGSGGKIITVLSLRAASSGLASGRFSLGQVAIPVGVGVGAGTGVPIVTAAVTATV
jgi:hypothetical protein